MKEYLESWKRAFDFSGRSRRKEFWLPFLVNIIIVTVCSVVGSISAVSAIIFMIILAIYVIAYLIPTIALIVRRFHDIGKSGWWYFIRLIPFVGPILLIIYLCTDSVLNDNQYGKSSKYRTNLF